MKKTIAWLLTLIMTVGLLAACGDKNTEQGSDEPAERVSIDVLRIAFVPSMDAEEILTAAEPLKALLQSELAKQGYDVANVDFSVGESFESVGASLRDRTADIAVGMPGGTYVLFDDSCDVILTATRAGLNKDFDDAKDWNDEMPTVTVDKQTVSYRSLIIAGPSEKGMALAQKVNGGQQLTWEELDDAVWVLMGNSSSAGYIYPALWLQERYGKNITDLSHSLRATSYNDAFAKLASGEADVLATYADARYDFASRWNTEFGREESIWGETNVIGVTPPIYNDTVTVSKSSPVMDERLIAALQEAFINIANIEAGGGVAEIYGHESYQKAVPSDYDNERTAQELMRQIG